MLSPAATRDQTTALVEIREYIKTPQNMEVAVWEMDIRSV